jgi:peptide deformylase
MVYDIVTEPQALLHQQSRLLKPEEIVASSMQKFIKDMIETMYAKDGVGLAAVQVGTQIQLCIIAKAYLQGNFNTKHDLCLINPHWTKTALFKEWDEEGCLSVPGVYGKIKRYTRIQVNALNFKGEPMTFIAENFFARIIQHEVDHLNGHLFIEQAKELHKLK